MVSHIHKQRLAHTDTHTHTDKSKTMHQPTGQENSASVHTTPLLVGCISTSGVCLPGCGTNSSTSRNATRMCVCVCSTARFMSACGSASTNYDDHRLRLALDLTPLMSVHNTHRCMGTDVCSRSGHVVVRDFLFSSPFTYPINSAGDI